MLINLAYIFTSLSNKQKKKSQNKTKGEQTFLVPQVVVLLYMFKSSSQKPTKLVVGGLRL